MYIFGYKVPWGSVAELVVMTEKRCMLSCCIFEGLALPAIFSIFSAYMAFCMFVLCNTTAILCMLPGIFAINPLILGFSPIQLSFIPSLFSFRPVIFSFRPTFFCAGPSLFCFNPCLFSVVPAVGCFSPSWYTYSPTFFCVTDWMQILTRLPFGLGEYFICLELQLKKSTQAAKTAVVKSCMKQTAECTPSSEEANKPSECGKSNKRDRTDTDDDTSKERTAIAAALKEGPKRAVPEGLRPRSRFNINTTDEGNDDEDEDDDDDNPIYIRPYRRRQHMPFDQDSTWQSFGTWNNPSSFR